MAKEMLDLLIESLRDTYSAEKLGGRAMARVLKKVQHEGLRQALQEHIEDSEVQVERLEQVFEELETAPRAKTCHAMQGLIEEQKELFDMGLEPELLDVALVAAQQKMEHYEIAAYGSMAAYAKALGEERAAELLAETLEEEKAFDQRLTELAEQEVNPAALTYEEGEDEEEEDEEEEGDEEEEEEVRTSAGQQQGGGGRRGAGGRGRGGAEQQRGQQRGKTASRTRRAAE